MNKQTEVVGIVEEVPFAETYISEMNPRQGVDDTSILSLAENIATYGLIQNLAGHRDDYGRVGIVAGGRRHSALALLQDDVRFQTVPVRIAPDEATARIWAASENSLREGLHPADEILQYGEMAAQGAKAPAIALAFGVSETHVYRRLALAGLPKEVLEVLRANEITLAAAACFTTCNDLERILEVLERVRGSDYSATWIKGQLHPSSVTASDRRAAFVGPDAYEAAGGKLSQDLFADEVIFLDADILQGAFAVALEDCCRTLQSDEGWNWVIGCEDSYLPWNYLQDHGLQRMYPVGGTLSADQQDRYEELAQLAENDVLDDAEGEELNALQSVLDGSFTKEQIALSGCVIHVDYEGTVHVERGLVAANEQPTAIALGFLSVTNQPDAGTLSRPAISDRLRQDLNRIETGARQNAALADPELMLHLLAFQLCGKMGHRSAFGIRTTDVENTPTSETGYELDAELTTPEPTPNDPFGSDLKRGFAAFRKKGDTAIMAILNRYLVSQLNISDPDLGAFIDKKVQRRTRDAFTPTAENFFGRVNAAYLEELFSDLLDLRKDGPQAKGFGKLKKAEKAELLERLFSDPDTQKAYNLSEKQVQRIRDWLPEGMS